MRVSAKAEYACVAMIELAAQHHLGQPVSIKAIADTYKISSKFLTQILLQLKGAGLAASSRGAAGGYQLARPPETISLADIIHCIDGSPAASSALGSLPESAVVQALKRVWHKVQADEQQTFQDLTLQDLVQQIRKTDNFVYQI